MRRDGRRGPFFDYSLCRQKGGRRSRLDSIQRDLCVSFNVVSARVGLTVDPDCSLQKLSAVASAVASSRVEMCVVIVSSSNVDTLVSAT